MIMNYQFIFILILLSCISFVHMNELSSNTTSLITLIDGFKDILIKGRTTDLARAALSSFRGLFSNPLTALMYLGSMAMGAATMLAFYEPPISSLPMPVHEPLIGRFPIEQQHQHHQQSRPALNSIYSRSPSRSENSQYSNVIFPSNLPQQNKYSSAHHQLSSNIPKNIYRRYDMSDNFNDNSNNYPLISHGGFKEKILDIKKDINRNLTSDVD